MRAEQFLYVNYVLQYVNGHAEYACMGGETGCARAQHSRRSDGQKRCCIIFGNFFFFSFEYID